MRDWNPVAQTITPNAAVAARYDVLFGQYVELYEGTKRIVHQLAAAQQEATA